MSVKMRSEKSATEHPSRIMLKSVTSSAKSAKSEEGRFSDKLSKLSAKLSERSRKQRREKELSSDAAKSSEAAKSTEKEQSLNFQNGALAASGNTIQELNGFSCLNSASTQHILLEEEVLSNFGKTLPLSDKPMLLRKLSLECGEAPYEQS